MLLLKVMPLKFAVTVMLFATFGDAKVPKAVPLAVEVSVPNNPVTIGVPVITSAVVEV